MDDWIGTREAAARLGITLRSLYRFIDEGSLPAYKIGRVIRLRIEDVAGFSARHPGPNGLEHLYPEGHDPNDGLSGVREPHPPRPSQPPGAAHLGLPET